MVNSIPAELESKYKQLVALCQQLPAYKKHSFCRTKNGNYYLKVTARKGIFFTDTDLQYILYYAEFFDKNFKYNINKVRGHLTITLYS